MKERIKKNRKTFFEQLNKNDNGVPQNQQMIFWRLICLEGKIYKKEQTFRFGYTFLLVHVIISGTYYS